MVNVFAISFVSKTSLFHNTTGSILFFTLLDYFRPRGIFSDFSLIIPLPVLHIWHLRPLVVRWFPISFPYQIIWQTQQQASSGYPAQWLVAQYVPCLLYTSDAADERSSVDLGGR